MLRTGVEGWTENDILRYCRLSSGRNYASELERRLDIQLERIDEKNPDGIGSHLRYRFTGRGDVLKVIQLVNHNADAGGYQGFLSLKLPTFSIYTRTISPPHNGAENMTIEKSRFNSEAAPQPNVNTGVINGNDFAAIVPVLPDRLAGVKPIL
jgi:hypothetical protein